MYKVYVMKTFVVLRIGAQHILHFPMGDEKVPRLSVQELRVLYVNAYNIVDDYELVFC